MTGRIVWVALVLATVMGGPLVADARDDYRSGLEAVERGDWPEVERLMRSAISDQPEAKGRSPLFLKRYLPHYHLGLALAQQGRCREAVPVLDTSEQQGAITRADREYQQLQTSRAQCAEIVAAVDASVTVARRELDEAAGEAARVASLAQEPPLSLAWSDGSPSFEDRQRTALDGLSQAQSRLEAGDRSLDLEETESAATRARETRAAFLALAADAEQRQADLVTEVDERLETLARLADAAGRDIAFIRRTLDPLPGEMASHIEVLERAIGSASAADRATPVAEVETRSTELRRSLNALRAAFEAPPEPLMEAATALFEGRYDEAEALLAEDGELGGDADERVRFQVCLLRTATVDAQARLAGSGDDPGTIDSLRICRASPAAPDSLPEVFSPAFLGLWDEAGAEDLPTEPSPEG